MGWRYVKVWAVELIHLDLDADADLRETLCNMRGKDLVRSDKSNGVYCIGLNIVVTSF